MWELGWALWPVRSREQERRDAAQASSLKDELNSSLGGAWGGGPACGHQVPGSSLHMRALFPPCHPLPPAQPVFLAGLLCMCVCIGVCVCVRVRARAVCVPACGLETSCYQAWGTQESYCSGRRPAGLGCGDLWSLF